MCASFSHGILLRFNFSMLMFFTCLANKSIPCRKTCSLYHSLLILLWPAAFDIILDKLGSLP